MASQKISEFNTSTELTSGDLFTFVVNGTNKNIAFSDLQISLGALGVLSQVGAETGTPVLDVESPTLYNIRNLESGKGVITGVSPENGITVENDFIQSASGTKIIPDLTAGQYRIKTLQGGEGVSISDDGEVLTFSATGVATPSNLRFIASEADFDNQTATTITLTPGIFYQIGADITTSKNVIGTGSVMEGLNVATTLTYTGTGSMFTTNNDVFSIRNIVLDCPNATAFECFGDNTGNVLHRINVDDALILNCEKILNSDGAGAQVFSTVQIANMTGAQAITFTNTAPSVVFSFSNVAIFGMTAGSIGYDLGSSVNTEIEINNNIMAGDSTAVAISGLTSSGNITTGNLATVSNCNFSGFTSQLSGVSVEDARWVFTSNAGLSDSISDGLIHTESNALETTISSIGVPVKLNAVFLDDDISRFTSDGTGRLTYTGEVPIRLPIDIICTVLAANGGDKQLGLCVALNGSPITTTCVQGTASSSKATALTTIWQHDFVNGDYIEAFVLNDSSTDNVVAQQCVLRIN